MMWEQKEKLQKVQEGLKRKGYDVSIYQSERRIYQTPQSTPSSSMKHGRWGGECGNF